MMHVLLSEVKGKSVLLLVSVSIDFKPPATTLLKEKKRRGGWMGGESREDYRLSEVDDPNLTILSVADWYSGCLSLFCLKKR